VHFQLAYAPDTRGAVAVPWTLPQLRDASSATLPLPVPSRAQLAARGGAPIEVTVLLPIPFALPSVEFQAVPISDPRTRTRDDRSPWYSDLERREPEGAALPSAVAPAAFPGADDSEEEEEEGAADAVAGERGPEPGRGSGAAATAAPAAAAAAVGAAESGSGSRPDAGGGRGQKRAREHESLRDA
jgi:hypothetical protein